jgi:hypothetical protein
VRLETSVWYGRYPPRGSRIAAPHPDGDDDEEDWET